MKLSKYNLQVNIVNYIAETLLMMLANDVS